MPANVDGMVREGVSAYRAGRKDEARALLMRAVEIDQYNEQAWLWLSAVVESVDEQRTCLENVLTINPGNDRAKQGLDMLIQKGSGAAKSAASDDVLASTSFTPPPAAPANPFSETAAEEELPSSIEWDAPVIATSSASSNQKVNEPSEQEYDDWVSNLNLGGTPASAGKQGLPQDAQKFMAMTGDEDEDDEIFDFNTALGISEEEQDDLFAAGPFGGQNTPVPSNRKTSAGSKSSLPVSKTPMPKGSKSSPDDLLDALEDDDVGDGSAFDDEFDDADMEKMDASEFFRYIPKEIAATRLPGTSERYPVMVILGLVVMIALNLGAVAFLVMRLTAN